LPEELGGNYLRKRLVTSEFLASVELYGSFIIEKLLASVFQIVVA
jgi:hypothetical protein